MKQPLKHSRIALSLLLPTVLASCTIEQPQLPVYESEWRIPLGDIEKTVEEILEGQDDFLIGADGSITIAADGDISPQTVGDRLNVDLPGTSFSSSIGAVDLVAIPAVEFGFRLGSVYPLAETLDGQSLPIPAFDFNTTSPSRDLPGFVSATLTSGILTIRLHNGMPVQLGGNAAPEQIQLVLVDPATQSVFESLLVDVVIPPGQSWQDSIDLSGRALPDSFEVQIAGGSVGSGTTPVDIDADARFEISVSSTALGVSTAVASFGAQSFDHATTITLGDSVRIQSAPIATGTLNLSFQSDLPVPILATVSLPEVLDTNSLPLAIQFSLGAFGSDVRNINLAGYGIDFGTGPGDSLQAITQISTPGSGGQTIAISATDGISAILDPMHLVFEEVTGTLEPISIDLSPSTTTIELPDELEQFHLQHAELNLAFATTLGLDAHLDLSLTGTSAGGSMVPLDVSVDVPASGGSREIHIFSFDETNSTLLDFLDNLPPTIEISGSASFGDGLTLGTVTAADSLSARWSIAAPITVQLAAQTIEVEAVAVDLSADLSTEMSDRIRTAWVDAEITSTLPIGATVYIAIASDSTLVHSQPDLLLGPVELPAFTADPSRPALDAATATTQIQVDEADIPILTQSHFYQALRLQLPGTGNNFVTLRAADRVLLRGFLRARVRMGDLNR